MISQEANQKQSVRNSLCGGIFSAFLLLANIATANDFDLALFSADITQVVDLGWADDEEIIIDDGSGLGNVFILGLPASADLDAYHGDVQGDLYFSLDTFVNLAGLDVEAGDVVLISGGVYSLAFDASSFGLPRGVDVDAVTLRNDNTIAVSFDTGVDIGTAFAEDEDMVEVVGGSLVLAFVGSEAGVDPGLDLNAAYWDEDRQQWYLSFDGPGRLDTVDFEDRDVVTFEPESGWRLARRGQAGALPIEHGADLDALFGTLGLFADGFESGDVSRWSLSAP